MEKELPGKCQDADLESLERATPHLSKYSFFGVSADVRAATPSDKDHLDFYFSEFRRSNSDKGEVTLFFLRAPDGRSFFDLPIEPKRHPPIYYAWKGPPQRWKWEDSPLPPFLLPPLSERLLVLHASAVGANSGEAVLFLGDNYTGKSTIALQMASRGYRLITDGLAVFESGLIYTLPKPVGIRSNSLDLIPFAKPIIDANRADIRQYTSAVTGPIYLVPFHAVSQRQGSSQDTYLPRLIIFLNPGEPERTRLAPLTQGQGVVQLAQALCRHRIPPELALCRLCDIVENARCYTLRYSFQPESFAAAAEMICNLTREILR